MTKKSLMLALASGVSLQLLAGLPAIGQTADEPTEDGVARQETVIVTATPDLGGVVQEKDSSTLFGLNKPIVDTPRSISSVSDELISRYSIRTVRDITSVASGTYTSSFFGVPGSLNVRGSIADNYFNGFQGVANIANFPTPVDATSNIEIVKGPPSPVFGAGQVGGLLNFIPKSARADDASMADGITGSLTGTIGSYNQKEATGSVILPFELGGNDAGLALFGKLEDSDSFYRGMHPESQVFQSSFTTDLGADWTFDATYQYIHSDGYLKNIGWNRITQQLIDDGLYISGQPIAQIAAPGEDFITPAQFFGTTFGSTLLYYGPAYGIMVTPNDFTTLDPDTVALVPLDRRTTFLDEGVDINEAKTHTVHAALKRYFADDSVLAFETFYESLDSKNYQSYGFATVFDAYVTEQRLTYSFEREWGDLEFASTVGVSHRYSDGHDLGSLNDFALSEDRRDLTIGPTPDDRFNNPFVVSNFVWADDVTSSIRDLAAFFVGDFTYGPVSLTLGGRFDNYDVETINTGSSGDSTDYDADDTPFSYNASLSYKTDWATFYGTYSEAQSLQTSQGGSLYPSTVSVDSYIGESELKEIGVKTSQFGGRLFASLALYQQERAYINGVTKAVSSQKGEGIESELRWLINENFGLTAAGTWQTRKQLPTDGSGEFFTLPAYLSNIEGVQGYGGYTFSNANLFDPDWAADGYYLHNVPRFTGSVFMTYDSNGAWGLTGGVTYATETGGFLPGSIVLPDYYLVKAGAYYIHNDWRLDLTVDNLFDEDYFIAQYDVDANANALPAEGRLWHLKLTKTF